MGDSKTLFWDQELDALADGTGMIVPKRGKDLVSCVVTIDFKGTGIKDPGGLGQEGQGVFLHRQKGLQFLDKGMPVAKAQDERFWGNNPKGFQIL